MGSDPEVVETPISKVSKFSVATNEGYKDSSGDWVDKTTWHNVEVWKKDLDERYVKGSLVFIEGKVKTESWEGQDGQKKYKTLINAMQIRSLEKKQVDSFL
jgi:single-strand DNA-binding protein